MQVLASVVVETARVQAGATRFSVPTVIPEQTPGRLLVEFTFEGKRRSALVHAESGWAVHIFSDAADLYSCTFDASRNTICVERFRAGDMPRMRVLQGVERSQVAGANFATVPPADLVMAVKTVGF